MVGWSSFKCYSYLKVVLLASDSFKSRLLAYRAQHSTLAATLSLQKASTRPGFETDEPTAEDLVSVHLASL
jgi:hypothetical protein